jgi:hypothetical protein
VSLRRTALGRMLGVMLGRSAWLLPVVAGSAGLGFEGSAAAASPPHVTVQASATRVEVGESFTVELRAMVEQGGAAPSNAEIAPPRNLSVVSQSEGTQMIVDQTSNHPSVQVGLRAAWQIVAQKPGRYTIPAPTVQWNGHRVAGTPVAIEVVPSTGRHRQPPQSNNPFLLPGGPGFNFSFPSHQDDESSEPRTAPDLALPEAPDPSVFVHTKVDKKSVVVGQQISLGIYVYRRIRNLQILNNHDAPLSEFLRIPLAKNPGTDGAVYATVAGARYLAELLDQMAIFPLSAGDLHTGQFRYTFGGGALHGPADRASEDQVIHVVEPPRAGRPVGYQLGDVGQFTLTAAVDPKRIDQGGEVAVRLRLTGTGNLPQSLRVPARTGVEWLEPERKESIEPQGGVVGGWRTFGYVVRIKESGAVDLGEVSLPYWDPVLGKYQVARAVLGKVEVAPKMPPTDPVTKQLIDQPAPDPFTALPSARTTLGGYAAPKPRRLEGSSLWLLIAAPPLLVMALSAGRSTARRVRAQRAMAKDSPAALARQALADAESAEKGGDGKALATALERALHLAIEGATGLKSRGVLMDDLPEALSQRGVSEALGDEIAGTLEACESVRFDPALDAQTAGDLAARVRAVVKSLEQHRAP